MPWTMAYAHDARGRATAGALSDLIAAIEAGAEVRVCLEYADHGPGCYKEAQAVWVKDGQVYGQNNALVGCCFTPSYVNGDTATVTHPAYPADGLRFLDAGYQYCEIFSTTGAVDMARWALGEHRLHRRDQDFFGIRWFVRR